MVNAAPQIVAEQPPAPQSISNTAPPAPAYAAAPIGAPAYMSQASSPYPSYQGQTDQNQAGAAPAPAPAYAAGPHLVVDRTQPNAPAYAPPAQYPSAHNQPPDRAPNSGFSLLSQALAPSAPAAPAPIPAFAMARATLQPLPVSGVVALRPVVPAGHPEAFGVAFGTAFSTAFGVDMPSEPAVPASAAAPGYQRQQN